MKKKKLKEKLPRPSRERSKPKKMLFALWDVGAGKTFPRSCERNSGRYPMMSMLWKMKFTRRMQEFS